MSNLFAALRGSADALSIFERQLSVAQNNVANASTPGYVRQRLSLQARPFDPNGGIEGGVTTGPLESARDIYAEAAVQRELTSSGKWQQQVDTLTSLQTNFDLTGEGGIPGALNQLYESFSSWGVTPNDATARNGVITAAQNVVSAFNTTAGQLSRASSDADTQIKSLVEQVNSLSKRIQQYNTQRQAGNRDPAIDAGMYSAVEELSELVPVTTLKQSDGSMTVLLGGQTPLVVGEFQYSIGANVASSAGLVDSAGRDITAQVTSGKLGGLLDLRNNLFASLRGDGSQQGGLNQLAQAFADRVNGLLTAGNISDGPPPVPGVPLFTYDAAGSTNVAATLALDPAVTADQLAAIDPGPPYASNGIPLALAQLSSPTSPADKIGNASYAQFYGSLAAAVGNAASNAKSNYSLQQDLVTQARDLRQQSSGVSLDEEAINVLQFQRSYQAAAKMISVLDELTQTVVNLIR
ncbi:MAG TPA: flagellar hook-associated protein FlgK [Edaphobacter sp.]|nr:flagellar hook-associated protein FlgK [Edaphobacter sp.]